MASRGGLGDIGIRCAAGVALVLATINPSGWSYVHWVAGGLDTELPPQLLVGATLATLSVTFVRATLRSIGFVGVALVLALVGAFLWVLTDFGVVSLENPGALTWIGLIAVSFILGLGLSWSLIRRRLSGQMDVDDVEE